ncbi:hypothetical protein CYLTODRAFT_421538 [Cylindrobasidium torrendii FP15055 ss-10]|uniref:Secreted protein n=1 Tax=Cylindrobasidium torrendii FP15055 ss-10 TaxID=1314674 RepID=A0A0D7BDA2_9AGAR|nr:hypothetical protein CYLTODRAFT_421538 [Cylindrobasidium torrendii FP15055 ss-10]
MLFTSFFTLALAAVSLAAPAPSPVDLDDRAVSFESIRVGLTVVINTYRTSPSSNNRANLCRIISGLTQAQRTRIQNLGFDLSRIQCPNTVDQLNSVQAGLGAAYQAYTQNQNARNTAALCAITSQLTAAQRSRIVALGINLSNVQCTQNVDQQLNAIAPGLATAYDALAAAPTVFANQLAYCQIATRLNAQQTSQLNALNLSGATGLQCPNVIIQNRLNNNILAGFGDAYYAYLADNSTANQQALCTLTGQLSNAQKRRLLNNFGIDVTTFGCT